MRTLSAARSEYDVIVAGLGAFGTSAAAAAAGSGARVLGLDRYAPPHTMGSSHGRSRIIREAYFEAPFYVPLVRRAYDGWRALQEEGDEELLRVTGGLAIGPADGDLVAGTLASAREHDLPHEVLAAPEIRRRYPELAVPEGMGGVLEPRAGVLRVEAAVRAFADRARAHGAVMRENEPLERWEADGDGVEVTTADVTYRAGALVLALGPWLDRHLGPDFRMALEVERQVVHWFLPGGGPAHARRLGPEALPVTIWEPEPGRVMYTVPDFGDGLKAGLHHGGQVVDPDGVDREVAASDETDVRDLLERLIPGAGGRLVDSSVCLYANSPDGHLVVGRHPAASRVVVAGGGSGHGFKFAPVVGEAAAAIALGGDLPDGLARLDPARFALPDASSGGPGPSQGETGAPPAAGAAGWEARP